MEVKQSAQVFLFLLLVAASACKSPNQDQEAALLQEVKRAEARRTDVPRLGEDPTVLAVRENPLVTHVRTGIDNYLGDTADGYGEFAIEGSEGSTCGLAKFDRESLKGSFLIVGARDHLGGGVQVEIVFLEHPDSVYSVWVYQLLGGEYDLRSFCKVGPPDDKLEEFKRSVQTVAELRDAIIY